MVGTAGSQMKAETEANDAQPLVELDGIWKSFGAVEALRGVDLDLRSGEVHALLGQNGAGKSTLIKILAGVVARDRGTIRVSGREVDVRTPRDARDAGIAVVYQELSLVPSMTVADNLFLMREPSRFGIARRRQIVRDAGRFLEAHGFDVDPSAVVADLPFAYRQLTEIAKALMGNVRILVLDEPTSSLSEGEESTLFEAVEEVTKRGVGVIYVTHRLGEVFRLSQRVTVLRDGLNVARYDTADTDIAALVADIVGSGDQTVASGLIVGLGPRGEQASSPEEVELDEGDARVAQANRFSIGLLLHTESEWSDRQRAGIASRLERYDASISHVSVADFESGRQIEQIAAMLEERPDAIIGIPTDAHDTAQAFRSIGAAGIPLVLMDDAPAELRHGADYASVVSADNLALGRMAAHLLAPDVEHGASVVVVGLARDYFATAQRVLGFRRWFEDERPDVTLVEASFEVPKDAGQTAERILEEQPSVSAAFVAWDEPAMAFIGSLRAAGRTMPMTTVDLGYDIAFELASGEFIKGVAAQRPYDQGAIEADAVISALLGKPPPAWIALSGMEVRRANVVEAIETIWHQAAPEGLQTAAAAGADAQVSGAEPVDAPEPAPPDLAVPAAELRAVRNARLRGVDLTVGAGEIMGIAGMVGSGRTEILETMFGLRSVDSGESLLRGEPVRLRGPRDAIGRGIALVPEDRHVQGLVLGHSIERNLAMPHLPTLDRRGLFRRSISIDRAETAMSILSIKAPGPSTEVGALSGGNQQKVVFGRWRDPTPSLLLLDEPTVGVDVGARDQIYEVVREAAGNGAGVVLVSSELGELVALCDRIAIVADGSVHQVVTRAEAANEERLHRLVQEAQA